MQRQRYVALGGPYPGLYDSPPPLDYDRILPIVIKAGPDIADLLADLVELFPMNARPDQMARIIERSDKVGEVSNEIKSKVYCVLDGKTAFGNVRMMFVTNNFKDVESFLNNGNAWKREASFRKGLLYMLQDIRGAKPYLPITPPKPSASRPSGSYRQEPSDPLTSDSCQPTSTPLSSSTIGPMSAQSASKGKDRGTFRTAESQSTQSSSKGKGRENPELQTQMAKLTLNSKSVFLGWRSGWSLWGFDLKAHSHGLKLTGMYSDMYTI
ncbi:hypothetical protein IW262DRAFT_1461562 [Armillaria fumosa]|nr:hypothetical protein IW262DRAFT_1461562 [Armillaria fumosa]